MFGKAFKGELGLAATFWKFGVLGISIYTVFVMFFAKMLSGYLQGRTVYVFFTRNFHFVYSDKLSILWTLCYYSVAIWMLYYTINIVRGVWKSSSSYVKSGLLAFLAKLAIIFFAFICLSNIPVIKLF